MMMININMYYKNEISSRIIGTYDKDEKKWNSTNIN